MAVMQNRLVNWFGSLSNKEPEVGVLTWKLYVLITVSCHLSNISLVLFLQGLLFCQVLSSVLIHWLVGYRFYLKALQLVSLGFLYVFSDVIYSRLTFCGNSNHRHFISWLVEHENLHFAPLHYPVLMFIGARLYQHYQGQFRKCASSCIYHTTFSQLPNLYCRRTSKGIFWTCCRCACKIYASRRLRYFVQCIGT